MTEIRHVNWCSQGHIVQLHSTNLPVGNLRQTSIHFLLFNSSSNDRNTNQPTSGHFVGMIAHVGLNDQVSGTTEYRLTARRASDDYATLVTLGTIVIPAGETGCFYSDFLSEGARKYFHYDGLAIHTVKTGGNTSPGTRDVEIMLGLDNDSSAGKPDEVTYSPNFN